MLQKLMDNFMNLNEFLENIPDFAVDIKLNAKALLEATSALNKKQAGIIFIGCAMAAKSRKLTEMLENFFTELNETEKKAAKTAAIIMNMNNIYYRFTHLSGTDEYSKMPVGLRMNGLRKHEIDTNDFELVSIAISALNGCGMCMESHEKTLRKHEAPIASIQEAVKIAAIVNSLAALIV